MLETNIEASPRHAIASVRFCIESLLGRFLMRFQGIPHTRVIQHDGDNPQPCPKRNDRRRECELERLERPCHIKTEVRWRNNWTKVSSIPLYWSTSWRMTDHAVPAFNRFASRAEAAIVTSRQCRLVVPGWLSINSNSSSQSNAESWAWSGPSNSFTALMNAENSRSAISVCSLQMEVENDSLVFIGSSSVSAMPSTRSRAFIPHVHQVSD